MYISVSAPGFKLSNPSHPGPGRPTPQNLTRRSLSKRKRGHWFPHERIHQEEVLLHPEVSEGLQPIIKIRGNKLAAVKELDF